MYFEKKHLILAVLCFILWSVALVLCYGIIYDMNSTGEAKSLEKQVESLTERYNSLLSEYEQYKTESDASLAETLDLLETERIAHQEELDALEEQLETQIEENAQSDGQKIIGVYVTYLRLDDDCVSNLLNAIQKIDGTTISPNGTLEFNSLAGPYTSQNGYVFVPNNANASTNGDYSLGVEELTHAIYNCALYANLSVSDYSLNNAGMAFVDNTNNLVIKSNVNERITITCSYNRGYLEVGLST